MEIVAAAKAGTMESNDIYIMISPREQEGVELQLESTVLLQFGSQIRKIIFDTLEILDVKRAIVTARDRGALDYTIRARVETAVRRGAKAE